MHIKSVRPAAIATATAVAFGIVLVTLSACGGIPKRGVPGPPAAVVRASPAARPGPAVPVGDPAGLPGIGERLHGAIPADSGQVVAVYGEAADSADSTVVLYSREADGWRPEGSWPAHNGRHGWTTDHYAGDGRSPVGVFTVTDAGGVLPDPGTRLSYDRGEAAYTPPHYWDLAHQHDFDYVIAIDYNRLRGTPPNDPTRPWGVGRGGSIWLHLDHGSGTSACIGLSREAMEFLLRTLDPDRDPVVVMGDRVRLSA
ncbi:L,D-transpeptidase family protein [Streptomyces sp. NPDC048277]|uniref:L,D-transpeptidase family protein n=1 Tax=Streptomyces sp. NPDC048277 TaxID=3155027 RepID=UPI0033FE2687